MESPKNSSEKKEEANDSFVNCFCKCKIVEDKFELLGFNNEKIKFDLSKIKKSYLKIMIYIIFRILKKNQIH